MKRTLVLLLCLVACQQVYSQKNIADIKQAIEIGFADQESGTEPYNLKNSEISFGTDPCNISVTIQEINVGSNKSRSIKYDFHASDIDLDREWQLKGGIFRFPFSYQEDLKVSVYQADTLAHQTTSDMLEMAAQEDNFKIVDGIEALAEMCRVK